MIDTQFILINYVLVFHMTKQYTSQNIVFFFVFSSGDTATCLFNAPHEDDSLPRVLPGKLLSLDAQCRRDRGTSACFVSFSKIIKIPPVKSNRNVLVL